MSDRVPTKFVKTLLQMAGNKGYDFSVILNHAGLDFNPLDETDPGSAVTPLRAFAARCPMGWVKGPRSCKPILPMMIRLTLAWQGPWPSSVVSISWLIWLVPMWMKGWHRIAPIG